MIQQDLSQFKKGRLVNQLDRMEYTKHKNIVCKASQWRKST